MSSHAILFFPQKLTGLSYKNVVTTQFLCAIKRQNTVDEYWFIEDDVTPRHTRDVFETILDFFITRVIGLSYPKFPNGGLKWSPFSPGFSPLISFFRIIRQINNIKMIQKFYPR